MPFLFLVSKNTETRSLEPRFTKFQSHCCVSTKVLFKYYELNQKYFLLFRNVLEANLLIFIDTLRSSDRRSSHDWFKIRSQLYEDALSNDPPVQISDLANLY